jgi:hypothetical protein
LRSQEDASKGKGKHYNKQGDKQHAGCDKQFGKFGGAYENKGKICGKGKSAGKPADNIEGGGKHKGGGKEWAHKDADAVGVKGKPAVDDNNLPVGFGFVKGGGQQWAGNNDKGGGDQSAGNNDKQRESKYVGVGSKSAGKDSLNKGADQYVDGGKCTSKGKCKWGVEDKTRKGNDDNSANDKYKSGARSNPYKGPSLHTSLSKPEQYII